MRKRYRTILLLTIVGLASCVGVANWLLHSINPMGEFTRNLPGGYRVFATPTITITSAPFIDDPSHASSTITVGAEVTRIRIIDHLVVGLVKPPRFGLDELSPMGYFVLDTSTHTLTAGLTESDWLAHLQSRYGITKPPRLIAPNRLSIWRTY